MAVVLHCPWEAGTEGGEGEVVRRALEAPGWGAALEAVRSAGRVAEGAEITFRVNCKLSAELKHCMAR